MWVPNVSVGGLKFGQNIGDLIKKGFLVEVEYELQLPEDLQPLMRSFAYADGPDADALRIDLEEDGVTIQGIHCAQSITLNGTELIGRSLPELIGILGSQPVELEEGFVSYGGIIKDIAYFFDVGLTVWLQENVVVGVDASLDED